MLSENLNSQLTLSRKSLQPADQLDYNEAGEIGGEMRITGKDLEEAEGYAKTMTEEEVRAVRITCILERPLAVSEVTRTIKTDLDRRH